MATHTVPATIDFDIDLDVDAALIAQLTDAQRELYTCLVLLCRQAAGSIARVEHMTIKLASLMELKRLGLIRVTPSLAFSFVSIVLQGNIDSAWAAEARSR